MPASVSPSNTTLGLARTLFASAAQSGARDLPTDSTGVSFSSTLQGRLDNAPPARAPGSHLDGAGRPRDPERPAERERPAEPERPAEADRSAEPGRPAEAERSNAGGNADDGSAAGTTSSAPAAAKGGQGASGSGREQDAAAEKPAEAGLARGKPARVVTLDTAVGTDTDAAAQAVNGTTDARALAALVKAGTAGERAVSGGTDKSTDADSTAAIDAGLPADLAALLPQLAASRAADGAPKPDPALDDSLGKSLQNSGLLPRMGAGTQGPDRDVAGALMMLQARESAVAVAAGKLAGGLQQDVEATASVSGANATGSAPASGLPHQLSEFAAIRGQAIAARPLTPQLPVHTPVGQEGWAEDVGNRVTWMLGRAESKAELVLTPPNLGKLEVSINLSGDQTTAQFIAANQAARDALEQALPRLREMLAGAGINLGETSVSTSGEQQAGRDDGGSGRHRGQGEGTVGGGGATVWLRQHDGMVDTFV